MFSEVYVDPGGFKKVREACKKNNFLLFSCNMDSVVPSYVEKTKHNDYLNVSVKDNFINIVFFFKHFFWLLDPKM